MKFSNSALEAYCQAHNESSSDPETIEQRRDSLYALAGMPLTDLFTFTSSGAEAVNQVLFSLYFEVARKEGKSHFIASCIEDAPTMRALKRLEDLGCVVKIAPVDKTGRVDLAALVEMITPRTALISVTHAHGLTGVLQPIEELSFLCKEKGIRLHIEGSHVIGKIPLSLDVDYFTFSGESIHAVQSSGAIFSKPKAPLIPLIAGREPLFDVPSFFALSAAARQALLFLDGMGLEVARLRDDFEAKLPNVKRLYIDLPRVPHISTLLFPKIHQEAFRYFLKRKGIDSEIGGRALQHLSRILIASGFCTEEAETALSFTFSRYTTQEEIDRLVQTIGEAAGKMRLLTEDL